jgi:hypothetical protein
MPVLSVCCPAWARQRSNTCGLLGEDGVPGVGEAIGTTFAEPGPRLSPACAWLTSATAPLSTRRADRSSLAPPCNRQALAGPAMGIRTVQEPQVSDGGHSCSLTQKPMDAVR